MQMSLLRRAMGLSFDNQKSNQYKYCTSFEQRTVQYYRLYNTRQTFQFDWGEHSTPAGSSSSTERCTWTSCTSSAISLAVAGHCSPIRNTPYSLQDFKIYIQYEESDVCFSPLTSEEFLDGRKHAWRDRRRQGRRQIRMSTTSGALSSLRAWQQPAMQQQGSPGASSVFYTTTHALASKTHTKRILHRQKTSSPAHETPVVGKLVRHAGSYTISYYTLVCYQGRHIESKRAVMATGNLPVREPRSHEEKKYVPVHFTSN